MFKRVLSMAMLIVTVLLSGCGYNTLQRNDEQIKAAWAEVVNQYQRRTDLIPNLVNTVKGFAAQEQQVLVGVTEARAKVGTIQATPELLNDPQAFTRFQQAQGELSSALSRLMVVVERYPDLKSNQNFLTLQSQIEGTENSILVARRDYNESVQAYNTRIRTFPDAIGAKIFYGAKPKVPFEAAAAAQDAPQVDFGNQG